MPLLSVIVISAQVGPVLSQLHTPLLQSANIDFSKEQQDLTSNDYNGPRNILSCPHGRSSPRAPPTHTCCDLDGYAARRGWFLRRTISTPPSSSLEIVCAFALHIAMFYMLGLAVMCDSTRSDEVILAGHTSPRRTCEAEPAKESKHHTTAPAAS
ncbi:hypothetical protein EDB80DRAFT_835520 [Ilyonectria destructans]|nr:hypothetical protein EDB80DRAFT_835520 [Ilyonectria destructans]